MRLWSMLMVMMIIYVMFFLVEYMAWKESLSVFAVMSRSFYHSSSHKEVVEEFLSISTHVQIQDQATTPCPAQTV